MLLFLIKIFLLYSNLTHFAINFLTHFIIKYHCPFLNKRNKEIRKFASFCDLMGRPICSEHDSFKLKLSKLTKAGKNAKFMKYEIWNVRYDKQRFRRFKRDSANKRDACASVFLWILRYCPQRFFCRIPPNDCLWTVL